MIAESRLATQARYNVIFGHHLISDVSDDASRFRGFEIVASRGRPCRTHGNQEDSRSRSVGMVSRKTFVDDIDELLTGNYGLCHYGLRRGFEGILA